MLDMCVCEFANEIRPMNAREEEQQKKETEKKNKENRLCFGSFRVTH